MHVRTSTVLVSLVVLTALSFTVTPNQRVEAQTTTGTIIGTVFDQAGAPLAGVKITAINEATGDTRTGLTSVDGTYRIPLLPPGRYTIRASLAGLTDGMITNFLVPLSNKVTFVPPITLFPQTATGAPAGAAGGAGGAGAPTTGTPNLVGIEDPTRRGNFTYQQIQALPLGGIRSFDRLALLLPGVAPAPETTGANGPGIGPGVGTSGQFSVNGQRGRANNFTIDGSDDNDQDIGVRRQGFVVTVAQPVESITDFEVSTLLADAEAGRNTGGQVNAVTRNGSNDIHGEVYGFFTDSALNARDFFDYSDPLNLPLRGTTDNPAESPYTRYQLGASIGIPLIKDKWHLFGAFERVVINSSRETHFVTPDLAERTAALQLGNRGSLFGADVTIPLFYPLPNNPGGPYGDNTYTEQLRTSADGWLATIKTDYQTRIFGWPTTISARYNFTNDDARIPAVDDAINASLQSSTRTQNLAFVVNSQIGEQSANEIRFSFGRTRLQFDEVAGSPLTFTTPFGTSGPVGRITYTPYSPLGVDPFTFPQGRANNTYQIADTYLMTRGNHAIKFGGDFRRVQLNSFLDRNYRVQVGFSSGVVSNIGEAPVIASGATFAGLGIPSGLQQALAIVPNSSLGLRFNELNLFANDTYRITPTVTLTLGLRYELNTVPTDSTGMLENELQIATTATFPGNLDDPGTAEFFDVLQAQQAVLGQRTEIYEGDHNNFAPRVGFAWDIGGKGRYALRAGYGVYYDPILGTVVSQSRNVFPSFIPVDFTGITRFTGSLTVNPAQFNPQLVVPGTNQIALPINDVAPTLGGLFLLDTFELGFTLPDNNFRTPYVQQYGVTFEVSFADTYAASVAYVGESGRKLIRFRLPNGGAALASVYFPDFGSTRQLFPQSARPNPQLGAYSFIESSANSSYNGLQATLSRRLDRGLAFLLAYTWSHAIDDVSDVFDTAGDSIHAQDELGRSGGLALERASAAYDVRHRFTASWTYDLPFGGDSYWLGGFQTSGIATFQSGQPFTVNSSFDANFDGVLTDRLGTTNGILTVDDGRTRITRDPTLPFTAFLAPLDLQNPQSGAVGRNTFRAQGIASFDLAFGKRFAFADSQAVTARVEFFNAFNRPQFAIPVRVLESPGFGSSVATSAPGRVIQFSLRYSF